ncbi:hypothetical protein BOX15_Mlig016610g3 [Macrostomum lignano]|uniref:Nitric oxide synthase-interacting protein zinc-finger domain-containing protein n=1 Tax=Macrostomum lignano TaxID=282301 RepID=A0A267FTA3_9PLAT|nr:hypothetical protein BOX15_Mlig016610g3 [Macrostomum lignano]
MTRHSRNNTSHSVYTYHEKRRDAQASEYGTKEVRVGRDSVKKFDCCCLTNQPCKDPVVTPQGYLYDREAILQYMLQQRQELVKQAKARERQLAAEAARQAQEQSKQEHETEVSKYLSANTVASSPDKKKSGSAEQPVTASNFWIPLATPSSSSASSSSTAAKPAPARPDDKVRCPMSKKPLRLKDLISIQFKPAPGGGYLCALTGDVLNDSTPLCVIRPSGCVVTKEAVDKLVRPEMRDPISGRELTQADIVQLQRGASGFAGSGHNLLSKHTGVVMHVA